MKNFKKMNENAVIGTKVPINCKKLIRRDFMQMCIELWERDLNFLENKGYTIIDASEKTLSICIKECPVELKQLHARYARKASIEINGLNIKVLFLDYL